MMRASKPKSQYAKLATTCTGDLSSRHLPRIISLNESRTDISHESIEKASALLSHCEKQRKNRALVCASEARDGANAHSFKQERGDLRGLLCGDVVPSKGFLARFGECGFAGGAAESLNLAASVGSESICFGVFAASVSPLFFCGRSPTISFCGSDAGLLRV